MKTFTYTTFAMIAFAANSVLCRYALQDLAIDAASFTSIRLLSGAICLLLLVSIKNKGALQFRQGSWVSALLLFLYAMAFSYAYISLNTGAGALILFAAVQLTMVIVTLLKGKMLTVFEWVGLFTAFSGLSYLLLPSATAPSWIGSLLMVLSGVAWGFYTLAGKGTINPLVSTANNFLRTIPFIVILFLFTFEKASMSNTGIILAITSGAVTSGFGYAIWYIAINGLTVTQAAVVQLSVPIIAAFGGVLFINEPITMQLIIASTLVLGGILISSISKKTI